VNSLGLQQDTLYLEVQVVMSEFNKDSRNDVGTHSGYSAVIYYNGIRMCK